MFSAFVIETAKQHAEACYPQESCGLVIGGHYVPQKNLSPTPERAFKIKRSAMAASDVQAVIHSHPNGPACPSEADMRGQQSMGVPWGIIVSEGGVALEPFWWGTDEIPPLLGRPFRHGVTDCYSIIRDYYRLEKSIVLKDYPRQWEWWLDGQADMYAQYFGDENFFVINPDEDELQPGDVFLAQVKSPVINHGGVYMGGGIILHQLGGPQGYDPSRLSCRVPLYPWRKYITLWLRHKHA
ncbi:C40 family peptidase [Dasania sp. GY-MA-18]|uniref:C40 family peptidase n=1 Tax=Dasania phycosphaerae TaxID=2950436 RepID=A0A9J6RKS1_9GAMM|nr:MULTISPECIES: C40 family peptidase [Dasania]MCR8922669.1 C40 family peptidase [Dasania sp. GY-MA-18]MCZ0865099.1 C40 family peptidase [Dasania phycosphaerae]MCZ0868825.1 C40 family peptidase [Dasania phycosphaerae]